MYSKTVMDHFMNPRNVGEIENPDGVGEVGNPVCGDIMKIFLKIDDNLITDAKFKTFGCGAAIASSSMATELVKGKSLEEAWEVTNKAVAEALEGLPRSRCTVRYLPKKGSIRRLTITGPGITSRHGKKRPTLTMMRRKTAGARPVIPGNNNQGVIT